MKEGINLSFTSSLADNLPEEGDVNNFLVRDR